MTTEAQIPYVRSTSEYPFRTKTEEGNANWILCGCKLTHFANHCDGLVANDALRYMNSFLQLPLLCVLCASVVKISLDRTPERFQQFGVDAAEAAVAHDQHVIAGPAFGDDGFEQFAEIFEGL